VTRRHRVWKIREMTSIWEGRYNHTGRAREAGEPVLQRSVQLIGYCYEMQVYGILASTIFTLYFTKNTI
jgi:hypothetical protein